MVGRQKGAGPGSGPRQPQLHPRQPQPQPQPPPSLIIAQHREIQALILDHKEMTAIHSSLKQELPSIDEELRQLSATERKFREDKDTQIKELYEKSITLENEVRAIKALHSEHAQVVDDIQKLTESKIQLAAHFKAIDAELSRVKVEAFQVPVIQDDVENLKQELQKGRAAVEYEKKTRAANLEQSEAIEKHMKSLQHEIEMLRAELANAEKRARAAAAASSSNMLPDPGYTGTYGIRSMAYGGGPLPVQYSMHQGQLTADGASPALYGHTAGSHSQFESQYPHLPKG